MIKFYNARATYCLNMFEKTKDNKFLYLAKLFADRSTALIKARYNSKGQK